MYWGSENIAPRIFLPRHQMEVSGQLHAVAALPPGRELSVHIGQKAGWAPEPV